MIGYQPNFRPIVRAQMAQTAPAASTTPKAPASIPVPTDVAVSTAAAVAAGQRNKTVALLASGLGVLGGGAAAYCSFMKGKNKVNNAVIAAGVFTFINMVFFGYVVTNE